MTKREHKQLITIKKKGCFKDAYYLNMYCATYTDGFKTSEIKEDVYNELKNRGLLEE